MSLFLGLILLLCSAFDGPAELREVLVFCGTALVIINEIYGDG